MLIANRELEDYANKRLPFPKRSLSVRDEDLLKKVSMLAGAVKVDSPPIIAPDINELYITEEILRRDLPSEKRILVDEIYKILYFNNQDPETVSVSNHIESSCLQYNIQFWADYFHMPAGAVRNIVNYVAYPILDIAGTKKVKDVLYFIDTELQKRRKELAELDRDSYLRFLEYDYSKRSQDDYAGELGTFGIGSLKTPEYLEDAAQPQIGMKPDDIIGIMEDRITMEQIEKEIKQITDG